MLIKSSSTITSVKKPSEVLSSFRGPLLQYPIVKSIDRNKGTLRRWIVFSQGKRSTLVNYLWGKLLWDELTSLEGKIFWHLKEITSESTIYLGLKALAFGVSKKLLRQRLESSPFKELKFITRQQYLSIKGRVNFFFLEEEISLRKVPKYSGYTKHYKDKGSLALEKEEILSEVLEPYRGITDDLLYQYLTVGEINLLGGMYVHPDEDSKKNRNGLVTLKTKQL